MTDSVILIRTKQSEMHRKAKTSIEIHQPKMSQAGRLQGTLKSSKPAGKVSFFPQLVAGTYQEMAPSHLLNASSTRTLMFRLARGNLSEHLSNQI